MDTRVQRLQAVAKDAAFAYPDAGGSIDNCPSGNFFSFQTHSAQTLRSKAVKQGKSLSVIRATVSGALIFADLAAILLSAVIAAVSARATSEWFLGQPFLAMASDELRSRILVWGALTFAVCCWFALRGAYTTRNSLQQDLKETTTAFAIVLLIDGFVEFAAKSNFSRLWLVSFWTTAALFVPVARVQMRRLLSAVGLWRVGAVVMGNGEHPETVEQLLSSDPYVGYTCAFRSGLDVDVARPLPEIATAINGILRSCGAEIVIVAPDDAELGDVDRIMDALNSNLIPYTVVPPIQRLPYSGLCVQTLPNSNSVMLTPRLGLMSPLRRSAKRLFDIVVSAVMLFFLLPLFAVLAMIIAVDGGSPFFGHVRIGHGGRPFRCLKFRSMAKDSDKILARVLAEDPEMARQWATNFKLDNDPRITKVGKFLRTTSLDELPQLINVLKGEMSLVGPRPVVAKELEQYYGEDVFYYHLVRPGITGLWQVSGRSDTTYERRVFLDAWYVRNWDHWTDLAILFSTVPSVLFREGAK